MTFNRRQILSFSVALPAVAIAGQAVQAQSTPNIYTENGIAIDGTDPVSYFTQGMPVAGDPEITHDWMDATWLFSSAENRDAFAADPTAYAPQYGGYCAWAVSEGYTASTIPDAWSIVEDKLYLNYSKRVQRTWEKDVPGNISRANDNWPNVLG